MHPTRYFRLALLGATLLSTPVLAATSDQANNPPPANNTAAATTPAPANNMATTMTPGTANNTSNTAAANTPVNSNMAANNAKGPDGVLHKYDNEWRASKLVGANVYDEQGQTIASVNDFLVTDDGKIDRAVLSVGGGILGVGSKLVTVPFSQLKFQPSTNNNNTPTGNAVAVNNNPNNNAPLPRTEAPAGSGNPNGNAGTTANAQTAPTNGTMVAANNNTNSVNDNNNPENFSIVLPGATADSLKNEQEFKYAAD